MSPAARERRWRLAVLAGLLVGPFFPASNVLFYVGTFIGERLLYFPSGQQAPRPSGVWKGKDGRHACMHVCMPRLPRSRPHARLAAMSGNPTFFPPARIYNTFFPPGPHPCHIVQSGTASSWHSRWRQGCALFWSAARLPTPPLPSAAVLLLLTPAAALLGRALAPAAEAAACAGRLPWQVAWQQARC